MVNHDPSCLRSIKDFVCWRPRLATIIRTGVIDAALLVHRNGIKHVQGTIGALGDDGIASHWDRCGQ
jgi:hypothetical protein